MASKKTCRGEEGASEGWTPVDPTDSAPDSLAESLQVFHRSVGQGGGVQMRPELFDRVQFGGVGRERFDA